MILYHGSFLEIAKPDLAHSRPNVDFGRGFYATPLYEQAAKWCGKFKRRGKDGIISRYEYDESRESELKMLKFDSYSEEWLDFQFRFPAFIVFIPGNNTVFPTTFELAAPLCSLFI